MPSSAIERFPIPAPEYSNKLLETYRQALPEVFAADAKPFNIMVNYKVHKGEPSEVRLAMKLAESFWLVSEETYTASTAPRVHHLINLSEGKYTNKVFDLGSSLESSLVAAAEEARWDRSNGQTQTRYGLRVANTISQVLSENLTWREFTKETAEDLGFHIE